MESLEKYEKILDVAEIARQHFSDKNLKAPPSAEHVYELIDALTNAMLGHVKALKKRVAELEARPVLRYVGTYDSARLYQSGELVTDGGSIWHCNQDTTSRPGSSDRWTLACKRGRDGKDSEGKR
jgi:hypothetical protein